MNQTQVALSDDPDVANKSLESEIHVWLARPKEIDDPRLLDHFESLLNASFEKAVRGRFIYYPLLGKMIELFPSENEKRIPDIVQT